MTQGIYLDYAATSAIRPPEVIEAIASYLREVGATPGRSGHGRSLDAGRMALHCRKVLAEVLGVRGDPGRIVFQLNATHALNTAIFGFLHPGNAVVRTRFDHNAVRRPIAALAARGVEERIVSVDAEGAIDLDEVRETVRAGGKPARLVVIPHGSNATGTLLPVAQIARIAHDEGAAVLLDAAQTVGHIPVDVEKLGVDMVGFSGHKGIPGPQGMGGLWVREGIDIAPLLYGGTGGNSAPAGMPSTYPDHLEAGTQNAPGIAGLAAATRWVLDRGVDKLHDTQSQLKRRLVRGLENIEGIRVCSASARSALPIVLVLHDRMTPDELAVRLEQSHGIQGRAGLHCAPEIHRVLGTFTTGALRLSIGWATTTEEIDVTVSAFRALSIEGDSDE